MDRRDSCVFYASWLDAAEAMPDSVRGEFLMAALRYALRGETTENMGAMTRALMAMVMPQIEANNRRYENGCKGGRPKSEQPNNNQTETKPKPKRNQTKTKANQTVTYNDNDNVNDNVNVNDNESVCEKNAHTHAHTELFQKFIIWSKQYAPLSLAFKEPLTQEHFEYLHRTYGAERMKRCAADLHNKEAHKRNRRAITTWQKFIEKM